jgi:hypothetical protein
MRKESFQHYAEITEYLYAKATNQTTPPELISCTENKVKLDLSINLKL